MHKKGAKLSSVHLFGFSKINRNYIQKGREIRRNMKRMKKVLSIVLSLAMILTSITVYNTKTAKAEEEATPVDVTDTFKVTPIENSVKVDITWDNSTYPEGSAVAAYIDKESDDNLVANNDYVWGKAKGRTIFDGVNGTKSNQSYFGINKAYTIIFVVYQYDEGGNESIYGVGTKTVTTSNFEYEMTFSEAKFNSEAEAYWVKWSAVPEAKKYTAYVNEVASGNEATAANGTVFENWGRTDIDTVTQTKSGKKLDGTTDVTFIIVAYDANEKEIYRGQTTVAKTDNYNLGLKYDIEDKNGDDVKANLSWNPINGATAYKITINDEDVKETVTECNYSFNVEANVEYSIKVTALSEDGTTIEIKKNTASFTYVPDTDPTVKPETEPTSWEQFNEIVNDEHKYNSLIYGEYYLDKTNFDTYVNATIWAVVGKAEETQWHEQPENCKIDGPAITFAIKNGTIGNANSIWVNGYKYSNASKYLHARGDSVEIATSALTEGINYIAIVGEKATATFAIKYVPKKVITINNSDKAYVGEGKEYTFGSTGYGYYNTDTKEIYKAGSKITVGDDMNIVSIDKLSVNLTNGAAIRIDDNQAGGIRFKADIDVTCGVDSEKDNIINAVQTGILLTTQDKLDKANNVELNIDNIETIGKVLNIENKGWFNDEVGSYCASLVNILEANYPRTFVARAYIKVTSNDGVDYVYSQDNGDEYSESVSRTIKGIANSIFEDKTEFNGYSDDEKSLIMKFAGIVDTAE